MSKYVEDNKYDVEIYVESEVNAGNSIFIEHVRKNNTVKC